MTTEPQTEAGRKMLAEWFAYDEDETEAARGRILAIEREARSGLDAGLTDAVIATLRRDDLCENTEGEHHSDDFVAGFLVALDTELQARAALASSGEAAPTGRLFRAVRAVIRDGIDAPGVYDELHLAFYEQRDSGEADGWVWECANCDRPVPPMGMCETCGVFGVMRLAEQLRSSGEAAPVDGLDPEWRAWAAREEADDGR